MNGLAGVESYIGATQVRKSKQNGIMLYIEGRKSRVGIHNKKHYSTLPSFTFVCIITEAL